MAGKKILLAAAFFAALLLGSCQKLEYGPTDDSCALLGLRCAVYSDPDKPSSKLEIDLLKDGTLNMERGIISYSFPSQYDSYAKAHCRLEATIPSTATLRLLDGSGKDLGKGLDGIFDLNRTTIYFRITAANGTSKNYQLTCK